MMIDPVWGAIGVGAACVATTVATIAGAMTTQVSNRRWPMSYMQYVSARFGLSNPVRAHQYELFHSDHRTNRLSQEMELSLCDKEGGMRWFTPDPKVKATRHYNLIRDAVRFGDVIIIQDSEDKTEQFKHVMPDGAGAIVGLNDIDAIQAHQQVFSNLTGRVWVILWTSKRQSADDKANLIAQINTDALAPRLRMPGGKEIRPSIVFVAMEGWWTV